MYPRRVEDFIAKRLRGKDLRGLTPGVEYQLASGGKRLRPALVLWLAEALGAAPVRDGALPFALAVELLHNVFLIQDDIQDGDEYRRGQPALWRHMGVDVAINVADYLLAECYALIGETPGDADRRETLVRAFTETFRTTVEGQALDIGERGATDFDLDRYESLVVKKTGRYLALGLVGAALVAGRSEAEAHLAWEVGEHLGPAFQIRDDLLDLQGAKDRGGERGCDIREGKPSVLYAFALQGSILSAEEKNELTTIVATSRERTDDDAVDRAIELYHRAGAPEFAHGEAERRARLGVSAFAELPFVTTEIAAQFADIAEFIAGRSS